MTAELVGKLRQLNLDVDRADPVKFEDRRGPGPWAIAAALGSAAAMFAGGYLAAGQAPAAAEAPAAPSAAAAAPAPAPARGLTASGFIVARRRATIAAQVTGQVRSILVQQGQKVSKGQLLAQLDNASAVASLAQAEATTAAARGGVMRLEAELAAARDNAARIRALHERGFATKRDLTAIQASEASLAAQVAQARANVRGSVASGSGARVGLDRFDIRAPFAGVVVDINAQPGEMISPVSAGGFTRTGICTIVDMDSLEVEVDVAEAYISRVREGQAVTARLDAYPDLGISGSVLAIVPIADRSRASFRVRIKLDKPDPRILPEMAVKVEFLGTPLKGRKG